MPRVYRKGSPVVSLFRLSGSVIPRATLPGLFSALLTFCISFFVPRNYLNQLLEHPYPLQPFAYIVGFALVFRTQVAYNRYWEAATDVAMMASKWGDAIVECLGFDEFPRSDDDMMPALNRRRHFQLLIIQRFSLMHALALQYLRRDEDLNLLCSASALDDSFPLTDSVTHFHRSDIHWRQLPVLGGVTESDKKLLEPTTDRVAFAFSRALAVINGRRADGGLGVEAPVLSRAYQLISDGMLGFRQARKIEDIPVPFQYSQAISAFLGTFAIVFPVLLSKYANGEATTLWVAPTIAFITCTAYFTLHKVARSLEDPFVHPPNDLPAQAMQSAFNQRLMSSMDALRVPADAELVVGEMQQERMAQVAEGSTGDRGTSPCWGRYAMHEPLDVRNAVSDFLDAWRLGAFDGLHSAVKQKRTGQAISNGVSLRYEQSGVADGPKVELLSVAAA
mgnify:CR=1 FL=1